MLHVQLNLHLFSTKNSYAAVKYERNYDYSVF